MITGNKSRSRNVENIQPQTKREEQKTGRLDKSLFDEYANDPDAELNPESLNHNTNIFTNRHFNDENEGNTSLQTPRLAGQKSASDLYATI